MKLQSCGLLIIMRHMKTKIFSVGLMLTVLSGCSMKEFSSTPFYSGKDVKFTGAVEDRVNLWPVAYWREPEGSIAWPMVSWGNDHFALRPAWSQYKRNGSGEYNEFNVFWPIAQFDTFDKDYRIFPFFWGKHAQRDSSYFSLFPMLWWNKDFAGMTPFFWLRDNRKGYSVFPLFWSEFDDDGGWHSLFPLYYYEGRRNNALGERVDYSELHAFCYLAGYERDRGCFLNHRFLPFYVWNSGDFYSLPFSRYEKGGRFKSRFFCGLGGMDSSTNGQYKASWLAPFYHHDKKGLVTPLFAVTDSANWCIPFYYKDKSNFITALGGKSGDSNWIIPFYWQNDKRFISLPYSQKLGDDGAVDSAFSVPLLSGYNRYAGSDESLLYVLMGLYGHVWKKNASGVDWVFPLFYNDSESFYTLLYGRNPRRTWLFPFYYNDSEYTLVTPFFHKDKAAGRETLLPLYSRCDGRFDTLAVSWWNDSKNGSRGFFSLPLLSGAGWHTNSCARTWGILGGLAGGSSNKDGTHWKQWIVPLYYMNDYSFVSIPFGYKNLGSHTNVYFAAGIAGLESGNSTGGWLFPVYKKSKDVDFDEKLAWLDRDRLPDDVKIWTEPVTNNVWNAKKKKIEKKEGTRLRATYVSSYDTRTHFLFSDNDKRIYGGYLEISCWRIKDKNKSGGSLTNCYEMTFCHDFGNRLLFRSEKKRKTAFSMDTREKVQDNEKGRQSFLGIVYRHDWTRDIANGTSKCRHNVLWRLWDWEEENGDIALDVFPGFTYDSKKNGYSKVALFWRFFRYENNPGRGKKVDFLFIPVWR